MQEIHETRLKGGQAFYGYMKNGLPYGHGKIIYYNGYSYEGAFWYGETWYPGRVRDQNGYLIQGFDTIEYYRDNIYEGDFVDGYRSGFGKFKYHDGRCYEGGYLNDVEDGVGLFTRFDTERFVRISENGLYKSQRVAKLDDIVAADQRRLISQNYRLIRYLSVDMLQKRSFFESNSAILIIGQRKMVHSTIKAVELHQKLNELLKKIQIMLCASQ